MLDPHGVLMGVQTPALEISVLTSVRLDDISYPWVCQSQKIEVPMQSPRRAKAPIRSAALLIVGMLTCIWISLPAQVAAEPTPEFVIGDPRITQSSGLATDLERRLYWTVNDSDDSGVVYALNGSGRTVGTLRYDAAPFDAESIAYRDGRLYVGDTGGNRRPRDEVTVYEFANPKPNDEIQPFVARNFKFPDGPHDTEAILVGPTGRILLVTKDPDGGSIYAPVGDSRSSDTLLRHLAPAPPYITDGTYLRDGAILLRSYVGVYVIDSESFVVTASAATPAMRQGESITQMLDSSDALIGTEGAKSSVLRIPIPTEIAPVPAITPKSSTPTPDSEALPKPSGTSGLTISNEIERNWIPIAVLLTAAIVAVLTALLAHRRNH